MPTRLIYFAMITNVVRLWVKSSVQQTINCWASPTHYISLIFPSQNVFADLVIKSTDGDQPWINTFVITATEQFYQIISAL